MNTDRETRLAISGLITDLQDIERMLNGTTDQQHAFWMHIDTNALQDTASNVALQIDGMRQELECNEGR